MTFPRASGILLHPTSFPGAYGVGDLGDAAYKFVDFLAESGQRLWQVMPLGPTGYGDSPYQSFSAFAGNPLLISLDRMVADGWLTKEDLKERPTFPDNQVDFGPVIDWKLPLLRLAFERFQKNATPEDWDKLNWFAGENSFWLDDYALFMALKNQGGGDAWNTWPRDIAVHQAEAVAYWRTQLADEIQARTFQQWQFAHQWLQLKSYANEKQISIIGDIPIFVAYDSADAWANPELFYFDEAGNPLVVAGVPPDYFSETGQRWGNPLYRWPALQAQGYRWWIDRFRHTLKLVDIARIDHFRGFEAYWEVPASEPTAINGRWIKAPGLELFQTVVGALGEMPIIAEDLGVITPEVELLRDTLGFPGMKILQFGFGSDATDPYLPHNFVPNSVVYTGSHDNDTTLGWWRTASEKEKTRVEDYLGQKVTEKNVSWLFLRMAWASVSNMAIVPLQDVLGLGTEARMNMPGQAAGNWQWRYRPGDLSKKLAARLREVSETFGRCLPEAETKDPVTATSEGRATT